MKAVAAPAFSAPATALLKNKPLLLDADVEVASLSETGDPAERSVEGASLSADGRCVAFHSAAQNLVEGVPRDVKQVYVRDRCTGEVGVASMSSHGEPGNEDSYDARLSGDCPLRGVRIAGPQPGGRGAEGAVADLPPRRYK